MVDGKTDVKMRKAQVGTVPPALLFVAAAGVLMLMSAWEPRLALPLVAFLAMVAATRLLGRRLYADLTGSSELAD